MRSSNFTITTTGSVALILYNELLKGLDLRNALACQALRITLQLDRRPALAVASQVPQTQSLEALCLVEVCLCLHSRQMTLCGNCVGVLGVDQRDLVPVVCGGSPEKRLAADELPVDTGLDGRD